jgi:hypothetical protein
MAFLHDQDRKPTLGHDRCQASLAGRPIGENNMRCRTAVLAAMLAMPPGARAAELVVGWEKGFYPQEDEAVRESSPPSRVRPASKSSSFNPHRMRRSNNPRGARGRAAPDFLDGTFTVNSYGQWAYEDRLVDLPDEILPSASLFDPDALGFATLFDATFGRRALYRCSTFLGICTP